MSEDKGMTLEEIKKFYEENYEKISKLIAENRELIEKECNSCR